MNAFLIIIFSNCCIFFINHQDLSRKKYDTVFFWWWASILQLFVTNWSGTSLRQSIVRSFVAKHATLNIHTTVLIPDSWTVQAEFSNLLVFFNSFIAWLERETRLPHCGRAQRVSSFLKLTTAAADVLPLLLSGVLSGAVIGLSLTPTFQSTISYLRL